MAVEYRVQPMEQWNGVEADCAIVDPPFGIDFGSEDTYNRDEGNVVDGYVEWDEQEYENKIQKLLGVIEENVKDGANILVFSGWNNSSKIHQQCVQSDMKLEGKMYWSYNFAPYCSRRPAHNVYEIFWMVSGDRWYYDNECSYEHCADGEANLSMMDINRDYHKDMPKYPTRLPEEVVGVLVEHFTEVGDTVFDPCAGSGMVGLVADDKYRDAYVGDINENGRNVFESIQSEHF